LKGAYARRTDKVMETMRMKTDIDDEDEGGSEEQGDEEGDLDIDRGVCLNF